MAGRRAYTAAMAQVHDTTVRISVDLHGKSGKVCEYTETFHMDAPNRPEHAEIMAALVTEIGHFRFEVGKAMRSAGLENTRPLDGVPGTF